jgi:hypothetical protein
MPRVIMRAEVTPEAKTRLNDLSYRSGMTQVSIVSRLVDWLANQPDTVQAAVLGRIPKSIEADVAKVILKRMASRA